MFFFLFFLNQLKRNNFSFHLLPLLSVPTVFYIVVKLTHASLLFALRFYFYFNYNKIFRCPCLAAQAGAPHLCLAALYCSVADVHNTVPGTLQLSNCAMGFILIFTKNNNNSCATGKGSRQQGQSSILRKCKGKFVLKVSPLG